MHKFCHPKHGIHLDCDSYLSKVGFALSIYHTVNLIMRHGKEENFRKPWLLDHFLTERTEDYYRWCYIGTDPATWKVKPITQLEQMQHICQG